MAKTGPPLPPDERERRDQLILQLFLGGWSEREIGRSPRVNLTGARVHQIIVKELEKAGEKFGLISEKALIVYSERLEALIRAIWPRATARDADPKSIEVARRLLDQQGRFYQITDENKVMPIAPMGDNDLADEVVELQRWRERHRKPPEAL